MLLIDSVSGYSQPIDKERYGQGDYSCGDGEGEIGRVGEEGATECESSIGDWE